MVKNSIRVKIIINNIKLNQLKRFSESKYKIMVIIREKIKDWRKAVLTEL